MKQFPALKQLIVISFLFLVLAGCKGQKLSLSLEPGCAVSGEIQSGQIEEIDRGFPYRFMIYLPPCYQPEAEPGYPVIYMIPGRSGGPNDWFNAGIHNIAEDLILNNQTPPFLLVSTSETTGDSMGDRIFNDLIPYIDQHYNTLTDRLHRAVGGGSLGGIAAYRLAFQHPADFSSAGMFGSGIINGEDEWVKNWLAVMTAKNRIRVFLNTGEGDPLMLAQARVMSAYLEEAGVVYQFVVGPGDHSYAYWATNMESFFLWAAEDW